ncbi:hypothetical protein ACUYOF_22450 [Photobacterium ganghwense]|uniref:hypothetical protein n=1 Tax=Photobacterium ganghwense TaxID=320778 RepID=UPI0040568351
MKHTFPVNRVSCAPSHSHSISRYLQTGSPQTGRPMGFAEFNRLADKMWQELRATGIPVSQKNTP